MIKKIAGNSLLYLTGTILNRCLGILLLPLYTRYLTPADYGILAICNSVSLFLGLLASLSLENAVQLFYFQVEPVAFRRFMSALWVFLIVTPLVFLSVLTLAGPTLIQRLFPLVPWNPYLLMAIWITYFATFPSILLALLRSKQLPFWYMIYVISSTLVVASFVILFVVVRREGALGSLRGQLAGGVVMAVVSSVVLLRACQLWPRPEFDWKQLRAALNFSLPIIPYSLCMWLLNISDRWILSYYVPLSDLGIYSLAYSVGMLIFSVSSSLSSAFNPYYYEHISDPEFRRQLPRISALYALVPTWLCLALSVLGPELLRVATRPAYYAAAELIPWISLAYWILIAFYHLQIVVIQYHRRTRWIIWLTGPAAALNIGLNLLFVPRFGLYAAAFNTIVGFAFMAVAGRWFACKLDPIPYSWGTITKNALVALATYGAGFAFLTVPNLFVAIAAKGLLLLASGMIMLMICGYRVDDFKGVVFRHRVNEVVSK